jgi:hypothetical protein
MDTDTGTPSKDEKKSVPPFPTDTQITRMLIVMNDALYAIAIDERIEHHRNAQNLFYSCKEWFALHDIGIRKDTQANMYSLDSASRPSVQHGTTEAEKDHA